MYIFFWFFKQLYYCLRRIFKSGILLLIFFFIIFLFLFVKPTFAFSQEDLTYNGFSSSQMDDIYDFIEENKGSYDSVICAYSCNPSTGNEALNFIFYNYSVNGKLYKTLNNYSANQYNVYSQHSSTNSVMTLATHLDMTPYNTTPVYTNNVSRAITNIRTGSVSDYVANYNLPCAFATNRDIYNDNSFSTLFFRASNESLVNLNPYIVNSSEDIETWDFDYLTINCGQIDPNSVFYLHCDYDGYTFTYDYYDFLQEYKTITNGVAYFYIPKSALNEGIVLRNGFNFSFGLQARQPNLQNLYYELGSYTMDLTPTQQQEINEDSDKQILSDLNNSQKETNKKLNDLNNSQQETTNSINDLHDDIMDDTVPNNNEFNLPSIEVNDITASFFDTLFMGLYNAITSTEDASISFTLFSHSYTINSSQFNFLTDNRFQPLTTFLSLSWYGSIGYLIIKDIRKMIKKIKEGNIENVATDDIKADIV